MGPRDFDRQAGRHWDLGNGKEAISEEEEMGGNWDNELMLSTSLNFQKSKYTGVFYICGALFPPLLWVFLINEIFENGGASYLPPPPFCVAIINHI